MAKPRMDLSAFVGKLLEEQDSDVLREGIRVLSQALMETEVAGLIGADRHERTPERTGHRNGYRMRTWDTRVGTIELAIPKVRPGTYFPSLLQPRRRAEHALLAVVQEAYVHGVSTRKVDELMKALGLDGVSKSEVSRICGELDPLGRGVSDTRADDRLSVHLGRCHVPQGAGQRPRDEPGDGRRRWREPATASARSSASMSARQKIGRSGRHFFAAWSSAACAGCASSRRMPTKG